MRQQNRQSVLRTGRRAWRDSCLLLWYTKGKEAGAGRGEEVRETGKEGNNKEKDATGGGVEEGERARGDIEINSGR